MESEKRGSIRFNSAAINSLCNYEWPGNVRELANLVERMAILYPHGIVGVENLPEKFRKHLDGNAASPLGSIGLYASTDGIVVPRQQRSVRGAAASLDSGSGLLPLSGIDLKEYLSNLEKDLIEKALSDSSGVVARAANRLQLGRTTLVEKMRKYNLQKPQESESQASSEEGSVEGVEALDIADKNKSASV
jgi:sigma-54 specific flagellar transcriptional regulator A